MIGKESDVLPEYRIVKLPADIATPEFATDTRDLHAVRIDCYPWGGDYCPRVDVRAAYTDLFFYVGFRVHENKIQVRHRSFQDPVYEDSCVEFFFNPFPEASNDYINLEINAAGVILAQIGPDRANRRPLNTVEIRALDIRAFRDDKTNATIPAGYWDIILKIPFNFFSLLFKHPFTFPRKGRGNFYKCGDKTPMPHYGCWSMVGTVVPDFHQPASFGTLIFA